MLSHEIACFILPVSQKVTQSNARYTYFPSFSLCSLRHVMVVAPSSDSVGIQRFTGTEKPLHVLSPAILLFITPENVLTGSVACN